MINAEGVLPNSLIQESFSEELDAKGPKRRISARAPEGGREGEVTPYVKHHIDRPPSCSSSALQNVIWFENSPATFQRLINSFKNGISGVKIMAYLEEIIVMSTIINYHEKDHKIVFLKSEQHMLREVREKCEVFSLKMEHIPRKSNAFADILSIYFEHNSGINWELCEAMIDFLHVSDLRSEQLKDEKIIKIVECFANMAYENSYFP
ncbi:hypothetical protein NPIL_497671 [Nephila pilipes]|uniref:Uncharacterized protein n=1 Tax=Nephila pilipes TaxID=299642 RepID=A0A8X6QC60_NEPPI|nr:hypothetical protein NPIL_497671 [Nephila pilipes]